jgi:Protein of unknown function (DUF3037)
VHAYEWSLVRVVPRVERGEFLNAGAIVYCQALDFLRAEVEPDEDRLRALHPGADLDAIRRHLAAVHDLCVGGGEMPGSVARSPGERFRWLTAPRSTIIQTSPVHTGLTDDPAAELERLLDVMVR